MAVVAVLLCLWMSAVAQEKQDSMAHLPNKGAASPSAAIHQEVDFTASPARIYRALLDTKQFREFSAQSGEFSAKSADIDSSPGGAFMLFDGHIVGRNVELVPDVRIVQAWRVVDWPAGSYSIVRFELNRKGSGTHLVFDQTGFPESWHDHLAAGWQSHYWDLLARYLH